MGRKKLPESATIESYQGNARSLVPAIIAGMIAAVAAAATTYSLAAQSKPLGVPVPSPPQPIFTVQKAADATSSVLHHRLPTGWLARLAPQPDGVPAMLQLSHNEMLGFDIAYPYGMENVIFGLDSFLKDSVVSQGTVRLEQPLAAVKISMPGNDGKKQLVFAKDLIDKALKEGAKPVDALHEVKLPGGGFVTLAYRRSDPDNNFVHRLYLAAADKRILILDFFIHPETAADGELYAQKIMRTFKPGTLIGPAMEVPPPAEDKKTTSPAKKPGT
jgi:hypothetical protein